jgi:sulfate adenylyltransferase
VREPLGSDSLVNLLVTPARAAELKAQSAVWPSWDLMPRQLCDLELLTVGGFSPLAGFMTRAEYDAVCQTMRLPAGGLWPIPITLDVTEALAAKLSPGGMLALRDPEGVMLAALHVDEIWTPDPAIEAESVYGTKSLEHPGVAALMQRTNPVRVGGRIEALSTPVHHDFRSLRLTPAQVREAFARDGWTRIVAFQTRNPMHRAHQELTLRAAKDVNAKLLIHPVVGMTKPGDVDHYTRVRCYRALLSSYPAGNARLSLLPLAMRMGGPREALWHALIRRNHGVTHFIVGRDHAGPGKDSSGKPFYGPYDAQELLRKHEQEIGIEMVPFRTMVYVSDYDKYLPEDEIAEGLSVLDISGTELRRRLATGGDIPSWFTFPAIVEELRRTHPPRSKQGFTIFFSGLSGSGKSTIANVLLVRFLEAGGRAVTMLDGDLVRKHLSSELGFSKEHRDLNIRRIGYVASEVTRSGGIAICAPIAPYDSVRKDVRSMVEAGGGFILVHVATPIEVCEQRDRKGLYAKARAGLVQQFTGVSDPYEVPADADLTIDTSAVAAEDAADMILALLRERGYLPAAPEREEPQEVAETVQA